MVNGIRFFYSKANNNHLLSSKKRTRGKEYSEEGKNGAEINWQKSFLWVAESVIAFAVHRICSLDYIKEQFEMDEKFVTLVRISCYFIFTA